MINESLLQEILTFRRERDWEQFHNLRTLATSIVLEAAELAEITQWTRDEEIAEVLAKKKDKIEEEVSDILILMSYLIHDAKIDVDNAVRRKLEINAKKYPVKLSKGKSAKYDML